MKKLKLIWLILLTIFCAGSVFSQETSNKIATPCENYGKKDFYGENITIKVEKTDIRNVLKIFADKYDCNFIIDNGLEVCPLTIKAEEVPWNVLLDAILRSQDLSVEINKSAFRVIKIENTVRGCGEISNTEEKELLYTEFIKLNYLPVCDDCPHGLFDGFRTKPPSPSRFLKIVGKLLSSRGVAETDSRTNSLIVTDVRKRLDSIIKQVKLWDNLGISLDEIIKDFESKNK